MFEQFCHLYARVNFASDQSWDVHWEPLYSEETILLGLLSVWSYRPAE